MLDENNVRIKTRRLFGSLSHNCDRGCACPAAGSGNNVDEARDRGVALGDGDAGSSDVSQWTTEWPYRNLPDWSDIYAIHFPSGEKVPNPFAYSVLWNGVAFLSPESGSTQV
jgi:hypothetical protein